MAVCLEGGYRMTRKDLTREIAKDIGLSQVLVRDVLDGVLDGICNSLARRERVELRNFGIFTTRAMKKRVVRNPKTKKKILIPAMNVVRFKSGKELKQKVA